jgi:hypothetical protein
MEGSRNAKADDNALITGTELLGCFLFTMYSIHEAGA